MVCQLSVELLNRGLRDILILLNHHQLFVHVEAAVRVLQLRLVLVKLLLHEVIVVLRAQPVQQLAGLVR